MSRLVLLIAVGLWLTAAPASGAQLDPSFGGRGWMTMFQLPDGAELGEPTDVAVQPDGKILVTGPATCEQLESCFAAARLNADGTLDAGFGTGGMARHAPVRRTRASDIAVQPDGRIVLAGEWFQGGDANADDLACVMRLLPDGRLDPSFSRDGMARLDHGHGDDYLTGVAIQGRRIVVAGAGRLIEGLRGSFAVTRFRADGSLDRAFGRRGRRFVSFGRHRWATPVALAIAPGGRLVVAGNAGTGIDRWQPAVARLTRSGSLDRRFGARGRVRTRLRPFGGGARAMQVDAQGRLVIAGNAYSDASRYPADWALTRYTSAGRLDRAFAPDGVLRGDFSPSSDAITAIALAGDRIIAAGAISAGFGVARYLAP